MSKMEMMGSNTRQIFHALTMLQLEGLPEHFKDIKIVNVDEAPGVVGDDWTTHLNDQGEAWIITPLHYSRGGSRIIRKTSRDCRWVIILFKRRSMETPLGMNASTNLLKTHTSDEDKLKNESMKPKL